MKNKDLAKPEFVEMIEKSWTWERLTIDERGRVLKSLNRTRLHGNYVQRWYMLQDVYSAFLEGCGYAPIGWREPEKQTA